MDEGRVGLERARDLPDVGEHRRLEHVLRAHESNDHIPRRVAEVVVRATKIRQVRVRGIVEEIAKLELYAQASPPEARVGGQPYQRQDRTEDDATVPKNEANDR